MNVFAYTDYRAFLKDYYDEQKRRNSLYSYRVFANKARLASPNYLKLVIDGARRITDKNLPNFIRGLKLEEQEAEYFRNLVFFQEAKDEDAKRLHSNELRRMRTRMLQVTHEMDKARMEMLKSWHHWAIREMILLEDFSDNPAWISKRLGGRVTPRQVEESLAVLQKLEFIRKEPTQDGHKYVLSQPLITTSDEVSSRMIREIHRQFIDLGVRSITEDTMADREINGLTIAIPRNRIGEFKSAIKEFRKGLNKTFSGTADNQEVYHLIVNFFPLTKKAGDQETGNRTQGEKP